MKIGDYVKIANRGNYYPKFYDMVSKLEFYDMVSKLDVKNFKEEDPPNIDSFFIIKNMSPHLYKRKQTVVYIEDVNTKQGYLIEKNGIEKTIVDFISEEDMIIL